jgi:hypothetical protein
MASLEKRYDGRFRIVFCWQGERRYHSLGKTPEREARSCLDRLEESLRFVDRGLLEVPVDADLGPYLVSGGKLNGKPTLKAPLSLGELLKRYHAEHPDNVKESSTRSTESIHIAHLVRLIDSKTTVSAVTTEALQGYVNARAKEEGRGGRTVSHVTIQKEIGHAVERLEPLGSAARAGERAGADQGTHLRQGAGEAAVPDTGPDPASTRARRALSS